MVKTRKMRKRSRKGGDTMQTLAELKTHNNMILADVSLGQCNTADIKEHAEAEVPLINELLALEQGKQQVPESMQQVPSVEQENPASMQQENPASMQDPLVEQERIAEQEEANTAFGQTQAIPLLEQEINVNGYTGTVGGMLSAIKDKISQLRKNSGNRYASQIKTLNDMTKNIASNAIDIEQIKNLLTRNQITFKNNKVFGGKTKKRRNKTQSKRQTKRRK